MQFSSVASVLFAAASGVMASPAPSPAGLEPFRLHARTCFTLTGKPLELCQSACKAACSITPPGLIQDACQKACDAGPLKSRAPEPLTGGEVCRGACAVTCNSTVLALAQKKCLEICNGECPSN